MSEETPQQLEVVRLESKGYQLIELMERIQLELKAVNQKIQELRSVDKVAGSVEGSVPEGG